MKVLERLFRHKVSRMLLDKGKISPETIRIMDRWRHSGFNVYRGPRIPPREKRSLERLAAFLIRSSFSQERMEYLPDQARVLYRSKDGREQKSYDALEWLAARGTHVPARGQQSIRYYGFLSNAARGNRRKQEGQDPLPAVLEPVAPAQGRGKNSAWARLIQEVYEVDPLQCPECGGRLKVISFITDPEVIRRILEHMVCGSQTPGPCPGPSPRHPLSWAGPIPPSDDCHRPARTSSASSRLHSGISEAAGNVAPGESARIALSGLGRFLLRTAGIPPQAARRLPLSGPRIAHARPGPKPTQDAGCLSSRHTITHSAILFPS